MRPTREQIHALPPFEAMPLGRIVEVSTAAAAARALEALAGESVVGFDTESQPIFRKGQVSQGPHVAQFATPELSYVFILHDPEVRRAAARLIESPALKKVGFGFDQERRLIPARLGVEPRELVDLERLFSTRGHGLGVGVKAAVAIALHRRFFKNKRVTTSNWSKPRLSDRQLLYAANDAYAALRVFEALSKLIGAGRPAKTTWA